MRLLPSDEGERLTNNKYRVHARVFYASQKSRKHCESLTIVNLVSKEFYEGNLRFCFDNELLTGLVNHFAGA
jgi:hypothetical protein